RHDVVHEAVDLRLQGRRVTRGDAWWLLLGLLHATLHRSRELGADLAGALRVYRYTLALGLTETAEEPGGLAVATFDFRSRTLPSGRARSGLGTDGAQQERSGRHRSEHRKVFHASTPSRFVLSDSSID